MIRLHPLPDVAQDCPRCHVRLRVKGWRIPGMRCLGELECPKCAHDFYFDLPVAHGLFYPTLLDAASGETSHPAGGGWFAELLRESYADRTQKAPEFREELFRPIQKPILLNCIDKLYGHSLLKLLNAQYYLDHRPDLDMVVLVPKFLRWLVPEGVAAIWTVDLPLRKGATWHDSIAREVRTRLEHYNEVLLSVALPHPHPDDFDLQRFSRVAPFNNSEWAERLKERPTVTFIWREDRMWNGVRSRNPSLIWRVARKSARMIPAPVGGSLELSEQLRCVATLAGHLRTEFPTLDFAVAGFGRSGGFPGWIKDLRVKEMNDSIERELCGRYAQSHLVIGVHGSNMLLPSGHAASTLELLPFDRWGNLGQDLLIRQKDIREAVFKNRLLPLHSDEESVALAAGCLLRDAPIAELTSSRPWSDHEYVSRNPMAMVEARKAMESKPKSPEMD